MPLDFTTVYFVAGAAGLILLGLALPWKTPSEMDDHEQRKVQPKPPEAVPVLRDPERVTTPRRVPDPLRYGGGMAMNLVGEVVGGGRLDGRRLELPQDTNGYPPEVVRAMAEACPECSIILRYLGQPAIHVYYLRRQDVRRDGIWVYRIED